jgi:putative membrane protein insertion efficiency factor
MGFGNSSARFDGENGVFGAGGRSTQADAFEASEQRQHGVGSSARPAGAWLLLALVRAYILFLSPFFGGACKFYPSCSNYAYEAIARHGARRGVILAMKRLVRCRPFTQGGFDPVPDSVQQYSTGQRVGMDQPLISQGQQERKL